MKKTPTALAMLAVWALAAPVATAQDDKAAAFTEARKNYWHIRGSRMTFQSDAFDALAVVPKGFVSLTVGGDEFLHTGKAYGGIAFRGPDGWTTHWPEVTNGSHDRMLGRNGAVVDGMFLLKFITGWTLPDFEIYSGFNDKRDHDLVVFLSDGVQVVRGGDPDRGLALARQNVTHDDKNSYKVPGCTVVHASGRSLKITAFQAGKNTKAKFEITHVEAPDGQKRLALVFPCKGHAANRIHATAVPRANPDNFLVFPKLDVTASNEKKVNGHWCKYDKDTKVQMHQSFRWLGREAFDGAVELEIVHALGKTHDHQVVEVTEADRSEGGSYKVTLQPELTLPGVSDVWVRLVSADGQVLNVSRYRMMYDWQSFQPEYNAPEDLKAFWDETLTELRKTPLEPQTKRVHEDFPDWELYEVSYNGWGGKRVYACLYVPAEAAKAGKPLPVFIGSHPGTRGFGLKKNPEGIYGTKIKKDPNYVTLVPLIRGYKPDAEDIPFNQPWWGPLDSRDDYAARSWYCAMVRGLDYMATRKDLADMSRVVSRGGSQGGALALITAALDDRVTACLADSPSNCMLHYSTDPNTYGSFGPTIGQVPEGQSYPQMLRTLSYYDPAHLAAWIKCPTVIGVTIGDLTVHSMGGLGAYKNLTALPEGEKWFLPGCNGHYHANSAAGGRLMKRMQNRIAEGKDPVPE